MFFEDLEDRMMYSASIAGGQLVSSERLAIPTVTLPVTLAAASGDTKAAGSSDASAKSSSSSSTSTSSAKPEFYSAGVMRFLVRHGYLTQKEADQTRGRRTTTDNLVQLKKDAQLLGASEAAVQRAISLILAGKNAEAQRTVIADGLNLPPEALKTKLGPRGLLQYVSNLQLVGAGEKASDPKVWQDVAIRGTDAVLADAVRDSLGIPAAAARGKSARQLLKDSANIALLGADARSLKAWQGLDMLQKGKIKLSEYTQHYTDASDVKQQPSQASNAQAGNVQNQAVNDAKLASQDLGASQTLTQAPAGSPAGQAPAGVGSQTQQQAQQPGAGTQVDPILAAFAGYGTNNGGEPQGDSGGVADAVIVVQNNSDGSYTATVYELDGNGDPAVVSSETYSDPDGDGTYQSSDGSTASSPPADGMYAAQKNDDGSYSYNSGESSTGGEDDNSGNGNGSSDGSDSNGDGEADDGGNDEEEGSSSPNASSSATPNPEGENVDRQAWVNFLLTTPMGAAELNSMADHIGMLEGGGYTDPTQETGGSLFSRAAFYSSRLGSSQLPGMRTTGGDVDYPDEVRAGISIDEHQLLAIQLRGGGTLVDPEHYHQPRRIPGTINPVLGPIGFHGGGGTTSSTATAPTTASAATSGSFSTTAISLAGAQVSHTALATSVSVRVSAGVFA